MYDPRTVDGGDEVPCDDTESITVGAHPGQELLVAHVYKLLPLPFGDDEVRELLVSRLVCLKGFLSFMLLAEEGVQEGASDNRRDGAARVGVE